jgi:hypothetical protein
MTSLALRREFTPQVLRGEWVSGEWAVDSRFFSMDEISTEPLTCVNGLTPTDLQFSDLISVWISQTIGKGNGFLSGFPPFSFTVYSN